MECQKTKVLILGASGMLGHTVFRYLLMDESLDVYATVRSKAIIKGLSNNFLNRIHGGVDVNDQEAFIRLFLEVKPQILINCVGVIKQLPEASDPLVVLPINSLLPHRLAELSSLTNSRLIHISTDCVFSGSKGGYLESDFPDAKDLYGRSKSLGEPLCSKSITLRTSIIGHELSSNHGLVDWFLSQKKTVSGYTQAIFSGLPTVELAKVIRDFIIPNENISGLFHVASSPISKYDLLKLVAETYGKSTGILPDSSIVIDRSLNADQFNLISGYCPPSWPELVQSMYKFR